MPLPIKQLNLYTNTGHKLTTQEASFISAYVLCKNAVQAVREAGYKTRSPYQYASDLLARPYISGEIEYRLKQIDSEKIASATEILQFYTSVMRGEVLDQFGIEASLDTRLKAANELAQHQIIIPMKLQARQDALNAVGSITLNFLPRQEDVVDAEGFKEISE